MDVKTALTWLTRQENCMDQLEGFVIHGQEHNTCKLDKTLSRFKQSLLWHEKFDKLIMSIKVTNALILSLKMTFALLSAFISDLLIFSSNIRTVKKVKSLFCANFHMKDLGEVSRILVIEIKRSKKELSFNQSRYIEKILKK